MAPLPILSTPCDSFDTGLSHFSRCWCIPHLRQAGRGLDLLLGGLVNRPNRGRISDRQGESDSGSIPAGKSASSVSSGLYHNCVTFDDDSTYCWGQNNYGQVGDSTSNSPITTPEQVLIPDGRYATQISAKGHSACAVMDNHDLSCWGYNPSGRLGDGTTDNAYTPIVVGEALFPSQTSKPPCMRGTYQPSSGQSSCIDASDGYLVESTGSTSQSPAGSGHFSGTGPIDISAGGTTTCEVIGNGYAYCWGQNSVGELGDGSGSLGINDSSLRTPSLR